MALLQGNKSKLTAATITAALLTAISFISDHEGDKLESYQDVVGVWTICSGATTGIKAGMQMNAEQCKSLTSSGVGKFLKQVMEKITIPVSPQTLAAHTSFAYNIGINGYAKSKTLLLTNTGKIADGCRAMANWEIAGGKDCRIKSNGCYGIVNRRNDEINLCLRGIK